jgi:hypothetical protein
VEYLAAFYPPEEEPKMSIRRGALLAGTLALMVLSAAAKDKPYVSGTITKMSSSDCGYDAKGGNAVVGALIGADSQPHKAQVMLCQDYTLKTDTIIYKIRPKKEHTELLPVNSTVQFRIDRDKMKLHLDGDKHEIEFIVVSQESATN